jgi:hypothetical protein
MWCSTCQQDVPLPATAGAAALRCGKCGQTLASSAAANDELNPAPQKPANEMQDSAAPAAIPGGSPQAAPSLRKAIPDDWELAADLRGVERLVGSLKASGLREQADWYGGLPQGADAPRSPSYDVPPSPERPKGHLLAWTILSLGLATFACGAVLLGWSLAADRDDLWPLGLPLALVGQAALIIGLVLQLDGLWHSNRQTAQSLTALDGELHRVRHATTLLTTTKNASAQSFYAHMAEGASPQLLLADLKGQLDLLAQQMSTQRR